MSSFFATTGLSTPDVSLRIAGSIAPSVVNAIYPLEYLTKWHYAHHIKGLTGTWMDKGSFALGGAVKGSYHRLAHGHHLFNDGFKVLVNSKLKFGEFLHHLGLDSLTKRGVPNPLIPKSVGEGLLKLGLKPAFVNELLTLNVPKVLGGSLALACAGTDVYLAFSDAIPHTFGAAGVHFLAGSLNLGFGMFPPNPLMLLAGSMEMSVAAVTTYRTIVDPLIPTLGAPMSVYLPALGHAIALAAILSSCLGMLSGTEWNRLPEVVTSASLAAAASTTVAFTSKAAGLVSPFWGPMSAIATYLLMQNVWRMLRAEDDAIRYIPAGTDSSLNLFRQGVTIPLFTLPSMPIGTLSGDALSLSEEGIRRAFSPLAGEAG